MFKKQIKSFTLIEVLIGIVVVGILSSFIIVSISSFVDDANDTKRKKDLDSIATSLLAYKTLTGSYPIEDSDCNIGEESCLDELTESGYATNFPIDPDGTKYTYTSDGTTYTIKASLSNNQTLTYNPDTGYSEYQGLAGYTKRKSITVASSVSLTNYQMKFIVHRSDDLDDEEDVYVGDNCQDDYDDIRFTNSSNQVLDYWIESSDSSSATIWVEADSLVSGNTTLYLYYGNSSETTVVSNGNNTFEFFDDFEGSSVDTGKWLVTGNPVVSASICTITGELSEAIRSLEGYPYETVFESYAKINPNNEFVSFGYNLNTRFAYSWESSETWNSVTKNSAYASGLIGAISTSSYHRWKIERCSLTSTKFYVDNVLKTTHSSQIAQNNEMVRFALASGGTATSRFDVDWVFVRNHTATEPSVSWGSEENI